MMKSLKLFWIIMKRTYADKFLFAFIPWFLISCLLIQMTDPHITNFGDALWFGFNVVTSIGLGDYTVTTLAARIITVFLGLYAALIFAFIPGLISSYYLESVKMKQNESIEQFLEQLEHLPELSKEQLEDLSEQVRKYQKRKAREKKSVM